MMIDEHLARLRAHRNNIRRYRRLLGTKLSDIERAYIVKRLRVEEAALPALIEATCPLSLPAAASALQTTI